MRKSPYGTNRKKRNLRYIREKNRLNNYHPLTFSFPMSGELDESESIETIRIMIRDNVDRYSKKYKIDLSNIVDVQRGKTNNDFIRDLFTIRIRISKKTHNQ